MEFAGTGAALIDIDAAIESCPLFIVLVDHDVFKSVPVDERADKHVYDTRGIWLDQPALVQNGSARSEEHTSELQSLMRISYAVFCLKKKKIKKLSAYVTHHYTHTPTLYMLTCAEQAR